MLLGRLWIHAAGAVTSSLHQCLKYIMNGMLVIVKAEETVYMIKNVAYLSSRQRIARITISMLLRL
jgi:hypothetical protein